MMSRYKFQAYSYSDAISFIKRSKGCVGKIRISTPQDSPYLEVSFSCRKKLSDLKAAISDLPIATRILSSLQPDQRELSN